MRRTLVTGLVALAVLATGNAAAIEAPDPAPDALLSAATRVVTESLGQERDAQARSSARIAALVESTLLPLFDFRRMTQLATAQGWRLASPGQQSDLVAEFRTLLVRTYSSALSSYRDQPIEYRPLRAAAGETDVTVNSLVGRPGPERLTIDYDMAKTPAGWKVYDVKIAGVSLVTTYRSSFAEVIREGGVDGLIRTLSNKNRQG
jgi:phospholipid transport system substrate-binding protein